MAISLRSRLGEEERSFMISIDQYGETGFKGVIFSGTETRGIHFNGIREMVDFIETVFREKKYPSETMNQRHFSKTTDPLEREEADRKPHNSLRRKGLLVTYTLRVTHRQNATWQGYLINEATSERFTFKSFLEMMEYMNAGGQEYDSSQWRDLGDQVIHHSLPLMFAGKYTQTAVQQVQPRLAICQFSGEGRKSTFFVRMMFFEHGTCQGVLIWKDKKLQKAFRSFLELAGLIDEALSTKTKRSAAM